MEPEVERSLLHLMLLQEQTQELVLLPGDSYVVCFGACYQKDPSTDIMRTLDF